MKKMMMIIALLSAALLFTACGEETATPGYGVKIPDLVLDFDKSVIQTTGDDFVSFRAFYKGEDISSSAILFLVEGTKYTQLSSMSFSTSTPGEYVFQVAYNTAKSDFVNISATSRNIPKASVDDQAKNTSFVHRAFFNQHTGSECPNCPFMTYLLKQTLTDDVKDKVVLASVRNYSGEAGFASVPNPASSWPYLHINFAESYPYNGSVDNLQAKIKEYASTPAMAGISANPIYYEDGQIILTVAVKAAEAGEYNVGVWLLQDNFYKKQTVDNSRLSLLGGTWGDEYHTHHNCARVAESEYLGTHIGYPLGQLSAGQTKEWRFIFNVNLGAGKDLNEDGNIDHNDGSWWEGKSKVNLNDLHFAAFVTTPENTSKGVLYKVVNAIDFKYNEERPFEYIK